MLELNTSAAIVTDVLGIDEAETLLTWLQQHPRGSIDFTDCTHLHTATLQVLMATRPTIAAWPQSPALAAWLQTALSPN